LSKEYVWEKMGDAVECLACLNAPIKERIWNAYLEFHVLEPNYFEGTEQEDFRKLKADLTCVAPEGDEGAVIATLREMTANEAYRIALRIMRLYHDVLLRTGGMDAPELPEPDWLEE
jgi:hypothetical protein